MDEEGKTGCLSLDDFLQVINSRDLGFQLEEHELAFIATQVMTTSSIELIPRILVHSAGIGLPWLVLGMVHLWVARSAGIGLPRLVLGMVHLWVARSAGIGLPWLVLGMVHLWVVHSAGIGLPWLVLGLPRGRYSSCSPLGGSFGRYWSALACSWFARFAHRGRYSSCSPLGGSLGRYWSALACSRSAHRGRYSSCSSTIGAACTRSTTVMMTAQPIAVLLCIDIAGVLSSRTINLPQSNLVRLKRRFWACKQ